MKKTLIASLFASAGLVFAASAFAQVPAKMVPLAADAVVLNATVDSVDVKKRIIVLKDANGNLAQMNVSKQINDLEKVKKGEMTEEQVQESLNFMSNVAASTILLIQIHKPPRVTDEEFMKLNKESPK